MIFMEPKIYSYLDEMINKNASDLYISVGVPAKYRINSAIQSFDNNLITSENISEIIEEILSDSDKEELESTMELNIAIENLAGERFRVNVFHQQRKLGLVIRHIKSKIPTLEELGLPSVYKDLVMQKRGMILLVGSTGSGKSTSMASMLEYRNLVGDGHVITIEDPIEFVFTPKKCLFTQREIGIDTFSYSIALKNALRQAPDVIMIGEIRDRETLENALIFSETGHLVLATIHSTNTNQTFERILSLFPEEVKNKILTSLSHNLLGIIGQRLVTSKDGKHVMAYEILLNNGLITDLIKEGKFFEMKEVMHKNIDNGMMTFDDSIFKLLQEKIIDKDTAIKDSDNPSNMKLRIAQYSDQSLSKSLSGKPQTSIGGKAADKYSNSESGF
jgi:twitching motility protein PilU